MVETFRVSAGLPYPLGATWDGSGVNVAVFSAHATRVYLSLFDDGGRREIARIALPEFTHEVWHGYFPDLRPGQLYGLRVDGPHAPEAGHRFNVNKLLIDPYAKAITGQIRWHDSLHGYRIGHPKADLSFDRRDSARAMPKCQVIDTAYTWGKDRRPRRPWSETIIYEAHVKGMTAARGDVPEELRGTFTGLATPGVVGHLERLGVTTVELMPVQAFFDERHQVEKGLGNYWGYGTIGFFAPAPRYLAPGRDIDDFKLMVQRLHGAGIEVILDVVYNHTAEGNQLGPTFSFRGIDNASYYVPADDPRYTFDTTGCGNNLNLRHPRVLQMVMDSLRYWVEDCHVDGFRFDLAVTLSRDRDRFDINSPFLDAVAQDPVLAHVKMISESWDLGPNGYQVGAFPPGWAEWNGRYRDAMRGFLKGDSGGVPALASHLLGSADIFDRRGRRPWASVNFVTAHDGFTLADLYSYNEKHNAANGEDNRDGHNDNRSWNCGVEGETTDPAVLALRERMRRFAIAALIVSHGTPMLLMGDEIGRTQKGNNNAYCQDGPLTWMDWTESPGVSDFREFVAGALALRAELGLLRSGRYLHGDPVGEDGARDVRWLRSDGRDASGEDWANGLDRDVAVVLQDTGSAVLLIANAADHEIGFTLPEGFAGRGWCPRLDSGRGRVVSDGPTLAAGEVIPVEGRCLMVFAMARPEKGILRP